MATSTPNVAAEHTSPDLKNAHLSVVDGDVEALAVDFVQQALRQGCRREISMILCPSSSFCSVE